MTYRRVGLLDGEFADGPPLDFIRVEQTWSGHSLVHERKLPRQVVAVVNASIAAVTAIWRHQVRGVSREKNAAVAEPPCDVGSGSPAGDAVYLDCEVGHTRPCSHETATSCSSRMSEAGSLDASGRDVSPAVFTTRKPEFCSRSS